MFCSITLLPSCQIWNIPSQTGVDFFRWLFWVPTTLCYLQNWTFCPITPFQVVRFEIFFNKEGSFFFERIILSHISVYLNIICSYLSTLWCLGGELGIQLQIHIWVVCFDLNLGSTLAPVPYMSYLSTLWCLGGWTLDHGSSSRSIFGLYFLTWIWGSLQILLWYHLWLTVAHCDGEVNFGSGSSSRSIFGLYFLTWI